MSHLGFLCFPGTGHLNPLTVLGRRLQRHGHRVTVFQIADLESKIRAARLDFVQIGGNKFPPGTLRQLDQELSRLSGFAAVRYTAKRILATSIMALDDTPGSIVDAKIDALVIDQAELAGGTIAEYLKVPFVSVALAMPFTWNQTCHFSRSTGGIGTVLCTECVIDWGIFSSNIWQVPAGRLSTGTGNAGGCRQYAKQTISSQAWPRLPRSHTNLISRAGSYPPASITLVPLLMD